MVFVVGWSFSVIFFRDLVILNRGYEEVFVDLARCLFVNEGSLERVLILVSR